MDAIFTLFGGSDDPGFFDFIEGYVVAINCEPDEIIETAIEDGAIKHPGKVLVHVSNETEDAWITTWEVYEDNHKLRVRTWLPNVVTTRVDVCHWPARS